MVSVDAQTADNTATAGSDYTGMPMTTLTFTPGQTSKAILVPIAGDLSAESTESFFLNLSNSVNVLLPDAQAVGTK